MKCLAVLSAVILATQSVSAHCTFSMSSETGPALTFAPDIFKTLVAGSKTSTQAVRQPQDNSPIHDITSASMTCNVNPGTAGETVSVAAGDTIGFQLDTAMYHEGPVSIYLGKAPGTAADWDGSGSNWFKVRSSKSSRSCTSNDFPPRRLLNGALPLSRPSSSLRTS